MKKVGCIKCGEKDIACLDYHHIKPEEKRFSLSCRKVRRTLLTLTREAAKCAVICSNCHRKHHYYGDFMRFRKPGKAQMKRRLRHAVADGVLTEKEYATLIRKLV